MKMTVSQYAALRGIGPSAVRKAIKLGHRLPGVNRREKFGDQHVLYVNPAIVKKSKD